MELMLWALQLMELLKKQMFLFFSFFFLQMFLKSLYNSPTKGLQKSYKGLRKRSRLKAPSSPMWKRWLVNQYRIPARNSETREGSLSSVSRQLGKGRTQEAKCLMIPVRALGPHPVIRTSRWFLEETRILSVLVLVPAQILLRVTLWLLSIYLTKYLTQTGARLGGGRSVSQSLSGAES